MKKLEKRLKNFKFQIFPFSQMATLTSILHCLIIAVHQTKFLLKKKKKFQQIQVRLVQKKVQIGPIKQYLNLKKHKKNFQLKKLKTRVKVKNKKVLIENVT